MNRPYSNRMQTNRLHRGLVNRRNAGDFVCKNCNAHHESATGVAPKTCTSCGGAQFNVHVAKREAAA